MSAPNLTVKEQIRELQYKLDRAKSETFEALMKGSSFSFHHARHCIKIAESIDLQGNKVIYSKLPMGQTLPQVTLKD
jgi:hypothetical protein